MYRGLYAMSQECKMCLFYEKNCHKHRANPHPYLTGKQETQKQHGTNHSATCQTVKLALARILYSGPIWGKPGNTRFSCHYEEYRLSGKRGEYLQKVSAKDGKSLSIRKQARKTLLKADILKAVSCRQGCTI